MQVPRITSVLVPSAARTATFNGEDFADLSGSNGMFVLNITAVSGTTPTLDIKLQLKVAAGLYIDIPGAAFAQKTATGTDYLIVHPAITVVANKAVSQCLGDVIRAVSTIGGTTPSFTYTLTYIPVE
jgi:hypothetical protein